MASVPLKARLTAKEVTALFEERYAGEKLVKVGKDILGVKNVEGKHSWAAGGFQVHSGGKRAVVVVSFCFYSHRLILDVKWILHTRVIIVCPS